MRNLFFILSFVSLAATAGTYSVEGNVVDQSGQPNIGVAVKTYMPTDSIHTTIFSATGLDGEFSHNLEREGDYRLELSGIGVKSVSKSFTVSDLNPNSDLGTFLLSPEAEALDEVVVTARKPIIHSDGATLTYNVEEDPTAASQTTLDMLKRVPMISVDGDDNIKIKGSSNFKIYINGKEDPMLSADSKNVLRSLPASTIKKIEVITEPGAKYDAEGSGGILNIITTSGKSMDGYLATLTGFASNTYAGGSVYGRTKRGKVTLSANFSYFNTALNNHDIKQVMETDYVSNPDLSNMRLVADAKPPRSNSLNGNINMSWEPDTLNLITLSGYIGSYGTNVRSLQTSNSFSPSGNAVSGYLNSNLQHYTGDWGGITMSIQHNFNRPEHNLTLSYQLNFGRNDELSRSSYTDMYGLIYDTPDRRVEKNANNTKQTLQLDYSLPVREGDKFEAGVKAVWRPDISDKLSYFGNLSLQSILPLDEEVKLKQINDVIALYATYYAKFGNLGVVGGLRYEHTRLGARYRIGDYPNYTTRLNDIVPNAAVSYQISQSQSLRLAYQMRINRPTAAELNPYVDTSRPEFLQYGNPDLKSSRFNNITLSYNNYGRVFGGGITFGYSQYNNSIEQVTFLKDNLINVSYENIGHSRAWDANLNFNWNIMQNLRFTLSAYGARGIIKGNSGSMITGIKGWTGNFNAGVDYSGPWRIRFSLNAGMGAPAIQTQGKSSSWNYQSLGLSRSFLKEDRLTISLQASNFMQPVRRWTTTTSTEDLRTKTTVKFHMFNFGGSISYRFGSMSKDVKQTDNRLDATETTSAPQTTPGK